MGHAKLHHLMKSEGLLVRKKSRRVVKTNSDDSLKKYPNLIKDIIPTEMESLWVSDMTYVPCGSGFDYLSLIMDAISLKIVGWYLQNTLESKSPVLTLKMALEFRTKSTKLIHH